MLDISIEKNKKMNSLEMNFFISFFCSNSFSFKDGVYYDVFHLLSFIVSFTHSGYFALADRIYIYIALLMRNAVEFKSQSCGFRFLFFSMSLHFVFFSFACDYQTVARGGKLSTQSSFAGALHGGNNGAV